MSCVDLRRGNDSNTGSSEHPFKTIAHALDVIGMDGTIIVLPECPPLWPKVLGDNVVFSTGKVAYANRGVIGLGQDGIISEGYDGGIDDLTDLEMVELADYMIMMWAKLREKHCGMKKG